VSNRSAGMISSSWQVIAAYWWNYHLW